MKLKSKAITGSVGFIKLLLWNKSYAFDHQEIVPSKAKNSIGVIISGIDQNIKVIALSVDGTASFSFTRTFPTMAQGTLIATLLSWT